MKDAELGATPAPKGAWELLREMKGTVSEHPRPNVICLCGSSRFIGTMAVLAWKLEGLGNIVLSLHLLPRWYKGGVAHHQAEAEGIAEAMDKLHFRKIDMADEVIVVDNGDYIGESTQGEIEYAGKTSTPLRYLSQDDDLLALVADMERF